VKSSELESEMEQLAQSKNDLQQADTESREAGHECGSDPNHSPVVAVAPAFH